MMSALGHKQKSKHTKLQKAQFDFSSITQNTVFDTLPNLDLITFSEYALVKTLAITMALSSTSP
jgi:hypothetical protein